MRRISDYKLADTCFEGTAEGINKETTGQGGSRWVYRRRPIRVQKQERNERCHRSSENTSGKKSGEQPGGVLMLCRLRKGFRQSGLEEVNDNPEKNGSRLEG